MTAKPKTQLMKELRAAKRRAGLVPVEVWVPKADVTRLREYVARLVKAGER